MPKKDPLRKKRIFVGFNSAGSAGIYAFTRELKRRGYQIDFYGIKKTHFDMPVDFLLEFSNSPWRSFFQRVRYFFKVLFRYDVWHFNFMEVFFFYPLNLFILKILGKKIVVTFRGIDVQTDLEFLPKRLFEKIPSSDWPEYYRIQFLRKNFWPNLLKKVRRQIFIWFADKVILTGPFLAGQVSRYDKIIPFARQMKELISYPQKESKTKIRILHVPSDQIVKGTAEISQAFKSLAQKYPQHSFEVLPPLPRQELLERIAKADIIVDQVIIGWYGGQAVEAMALGKIVMAFLNPTYLQLVPFGKEIPIWNTNCWSFENDLETLIKIFPYIKDDWQKKSSRFAQKVHDSRRIAQKYLAVYQEAYEK